MIEATIFQWIYDLSFDEKSINKILHNTTEPCVLAKYRTKLYRKVSSFFPFFHFGYTLSL